MSGYWWLRLGMVALITVVDGHRILTSHGFISALALVSAVILAFSLGVEREQGKHTVIL